MTGVRELFAGAILALLVTVAERGAVQLVDASGARDAPALVLVLLLAAFLGVLTAVATRMAGLPGATPGCASAGRRRLVSVISRSASPGKGAVAPDSRLRGSSV